MWPFDATSRPGARRALFAYIVGWLLAAAAIAALAVVALDGSEPEEVNVPPVRETKLDSAARAAECRLERARPGQRLNPPVDGVAATAPAAPGTYETPVTSAALVAAMRRGVIVIHVRADASEETLDMLEDLREAVPEGTIVAKNETAMPFALAVTAYRNLLGCPRVDARTFDAVSLFRGRFVGTGPDG
ncbi:MAG TPA: DUF3105 domain-containing protein [Solirubrobacteraceae bacterium]|nr:DUF3105 domain-containing protein [Solirubrobacteraceae bacterium]